MIYIQHGKVAQIVTKDTVNWYSGSHCQSQIWLIFMLHNKIAINSPLTCGLSCLGDFENHWMTCSSLGLFHWNLLWGAPRSAGTLKVTRPAWWCSGVGLGPWDFPWGVAATHPGWVAPPLPSNWRWLEPPPGPPPPVPTGRASRRTGRYRLGLFQLHACLWPFSTPRGGGVPPLRVCVSTAAVYSFVILEMGNTGVTCAGRSRTWEIALCPQ